MSRWLVYSLFILAVVAVAVFLLFPRLRDSILGFFHRGEVVLTKAEEMDVEFDGGKVQTMLAVRIEFLVQPSDAENRGEDFVLKDSKGAEVWYSWHSKEVAADDERSMVRISGVIVLPRRFRRGTFWVADRRIGTLEIPSVPYEAK
ncbi:MAG: hypothetical protein N3A38_01015 [Planctomycetota bacterium]|nr:hypothetical protein [Planctomycetota bacterium]